MADVLDPQLEAEIEAAYAAYEGRPVLIPAEETTTMGGVDGWAVEFELLIIGLLGQGRRRPNPKADSMLRKGKRYKVRKDHGTCAYEREIAQANSQRGSRVAGSVRDMRKWRKREARCDAATLAKLSRIS